ncbi:MAG: hypothetical protein RJA70_4121, partial [Pseudomonadota bacterium]
DPVEAVVSKVALARRNIFDQAARGCRFTTR